MKRYFGLVLILLIVLTGCKQEARQESQTEPPKKEERQYKSIKIGNQIWMAKNLNTDRFRNGDPIPEVQSLDDWRTANKLREPAWCYYENKSVNGMKYGKLYNWYAVNDPRGLAPEGWHIPSANEFEELKEEVGNNSFVLKEIGRDIFALDGFGTTTTSFTALLAGGRVDNGPLNSYFPAGSFNMLGIYAYFWTSSQIDADKAYSIKLERQSSGIDLIEKVKQCGLSVRCLKDRY